MMREEEPMFFSKRDPKSSHIRSERFKGFPMPSDGISVISQGVLSIVPKIYEPSLKNERMTSQMMTEELEMGLSRAGISVFDRETVLGKESAMGRDSAMGRESAMSKNRGVIP